MNLNFKIDYLYKSPDEWKALKNYLDDPYFIKCYTNTKRALSALQKQADKTLIDVPWLLNEDSPRNPICNRVIKNIVQRSAVVWYIDHSQACLDYLWKSLDYFCDHAPFSTEKTVHNTARPLHANLETADASYIVAFVLDTFRDLIPKNIKNKLTKRLINESIQGYLDGISKGDWWRYANFNWGAALHGNNACAALAIWNTHRDLAYEVLRQAFRGFTYLLNDLPRGNWCTEGTMYQGTTINHLTDFLSIWHRITGDDLGFLNNPFVEMSIDFHMHMQGKDGLPLNLSNCNANTRERGGAQFYWWARQYNRPDWSGYEEKITRSWADTHGAFNDVEAFWYREPKEKIKHPKLNRLFHFPGLDWLTFHTGDMWGCFRSGYNFGNHNHLSLGHFILGYKNERFLISPGYGASLQEKHNIVTAGQQCEASEARIMYQYQWEDGMYWVCDLQTAYMNRVSLFNRHICIIENTHFLVIDHAIGKQGQRPGLNWHLQSKCDAHFKEMGIIFEGEKHKLQIDFLNKTSCHKNETWEFTTDTNPTSETLRSLEWKTAEDSVHVCHAMMMSFERKDYIYERNENTIKVTLAKKSYEIDLYDLAFRTQ